jgi:hypothetical protein
MESIKKILADLKEFHQWESTWKETQHKLVDRERKLATEYAAYSLDVRQELMQRPMSYSDWYEAHKLEE